MKTGRNLVDMAQELTRRSEAKEDFMAPTKKLEIVPGIDSGHQLVIDNNRAFDITNHAHRQIGTWAGVPAKYYDRMRDEAPQLLQENINHWFGESDKARMVRTLDGDARAFLSDRYRRIDNEDVAEAVLPVLLEGEFARIASCEVTERKMYIKAVFPKVRGEVTVGDEVQAGVIIQNSEIGLSALDISPFIETLACTNGMVIRDHGLRRYHVGRKVEGDGSQAYNIFTDDTIKADDHALMLKVRDIIMGMGNRELFDQIIAKMREATEGIKLASPVEAVEVLAKSYSFNQSEKTSVLENLMRDGDYSRYGVLNAITATANNHESYDRATEFEEMGGKILDMKPSEWKVIAEAAAA